MAQLHFLAFYGKRILTGGTVESGRESLREFRKIYDSLRQKDDFGNYLVIDLSNPANKAKLGVEYFVNDLQKNLVDNTPMPFNYYCYAVRVDGRYFEVRGKACFNCSNGRDVLIPLLVKAQAESDATVLKAQQFLDDLKNAQNNQNQSGNNSNNNSNTTTDTFGFSPWMLAGGVLLFLLATAGEPKKKRKRA